MITLKKEFRRKGILFKQVYNDDDMFIYELSSNSSSWYEVFKRRTRPANNWYHDDEYEIYPSDESFGQWAWSCSNLNSLSKILKREFGLTDTSLIISKFTMACSQERVKKC